MTVEFAGELNLSMLEGNINKSQLRKGAKISKNTLNSMLKGERDASAKQAHRLIKILRPEDKVKFEALATGYIPVSLEEAFSDPRNIGIIRIPAENLTLIKDRS